MRVTKTKIETTFYDTNGKQVSVVRKEVTEVDTQICFLNRKGTKQLKEHVEIYQSNLHQAKKVKNNLEEVHGSVKGGRIFRSMADLIMVVDNPVNLKHVPESTVTVVVHKIKPVSDSIWEQANEQYKDFQESLSKKKKR